MVIHTTLVVAIVLQWHRFGVHGVIGLLFVRLGMLLMSDVVVVCDGRITMSYFGCFLITYLCQDCLWPDIAIFVLYFDARRVEISQLLPMADAHAIVPYVAAKAAPRPRGGPYARLVDVAPTMVAVPQFLIALRDIPDGAPLPRATSAIINEVGHYLSLCNADDRKYWLDTIVVRRPCAIGRIAAVFARLASVSRRHAARRIASNGAVAVPVDSDNVIRG